MLFNITESEEAETRFRHLLEESPDAIVVINKQSRIVFINSQIMGYWLIK